MFTPIEAQRPVDVFHIEGHALRVGDMVIEEFRNRRLLKLLRQERNRIVWLVQSAPNTLEEFSVRPHALYTARLASPKWTVPPKIALKAQRWLREKGIVS